MAVISFKRLIFCGVVVSLLLSSLSLAVRADNLDQSIRDQVRKTDQGCLDTSMSYITQLGEARSALAIAGVLPTEVRNDSYKSILVGGLMVRILKPIVGKSRPQGDGSIEYNHFTSNNNYHAFPSGHTTVAFSLATVIADNYPDYKWYSYGLATLVGISRLYEDVHWASDVAAGAGLGYLSAKFVRYKW